MEDGGCSVAEFVVVMIVVECLFAIDRSSYCGDDRNARRPNKKRYGRKTEIKNMMDFGLRYGSIRVWIPIRFGDGEKRVLAWRQFENNVSLEFNCPIISHVKFAFFLECFECTL